MLSKFEYSILDNLSVYVICGKSNWTTDEGKKQSAIRFEPIDPISLKPNTCLCVFKVNDRIPRHNNLCYSIFENIILSININYLPGFNCVKSFYCYVSRTIK